MNKAKMKTMTKLARTTNYILITDKETVMFHKNIDPGKFEDIQRVANQQSALGILRDNLIKVIDRYDKYINRQTNVAGVDVVKKRKADNKATTVPKSAPKKIKVVKK